MGKDLITVDTAPALEAAHAQHKRNVRLGKEARVPFTARAAPPSSADKGKEPVRDTGFAPSALPSLSLPPVFGGAKKRAPKKPADDDDDDDDEGLSVGSGDSDDDDDDADAEKEALEALKRRTLLAAKITDYYREFPYTRPGGESQKKPPSWSAGDAEDKLNAEHARIRLLMDSTTAKQTVRRIFVQLMTLAETVTTDTEHGGWGINPLDLDLEGLGKASQANIAQFEPELTEAAIEMREWLSTSWEVRLAFKAVAFTQAYSALKKDPQMMEHLRAAQQAARAAQQGGSRDADL